MQAETVDVLFVGGGIVSATLASLLVRAEPTWSMLVCERLNRVGVEASNGWNNAGTGHAAFCELNYTPANAAGSIDISKALAVHEQFLVTSQYWAGLVREGALGSPESFINSTPHMAFVRGSDDHAFLRARHETLISHHFFDDMQFSDDHSRVETWAPLLTAQRPANETIAATFAAGGTDVDFGSITEQLFDDFETRGGEIRFDTEVTQLFRNTDGIWTVHMKCRTSGTVRKVRARTVLVGAGGWTLKLLRSAGADEVRGYGLLPVSGTFLSTTAPAVVKQHHVKAYGKAPIGAPPMSMPHLDARVIDGQLSVLFGPFAGAIPKFLKHGSAWDLLGSIRPDNLLPLMNMGIKNLNLVSLLLRDLMANQNSKMRSLREFAPSAVSDDWKSITAGQRAQIVKPNGRTRGVLQFGTEVITSAEGSLAGVLGASPGASTAVPIALDIIKKCFPNEIEKWNRTCFQEYIPSVGHRLVDNPDFTARTKNSVSEVLKVPMTM